MKRYIVDTHVHTSEVSACGHIPGAEVASMYAESGYDAIVVTDHYHDQFFAPLQGPWPHRLDAYLAGYRAARKAGEELGIRVILGVELKFLDSPNDYLLFGPDEQYLLEHPALNERTVDEVRGMMDALGGLLVAAHPFRPRMDPVDPRTVHGVEVLNGHPNHPSDNPRALRFADEHGLLMTGGSDAHFAEGVARACMVFERDIRDGLGLAAAIRNGENEIIGPDGFRLRVSPGRKAKATTAPTRPQGPCR